MKYSGIEQMMIAHNRDNFQGGYLNCERGSNFIKMEVRRKESEYLRHRKKEVKTLAPVNAFSIMGFLRKLFCLGRNSRKISTVSHGAC